MTVHRFRKGLQLPILGEPDLSREDRKIPRKVAVVADDYIGLRPSMFVDVGDEVKLGQRLFGDKKLPGVIYTSPASGKITAIHRGERRAFQSLVIQLSGQDEESYSSYSGKHPNEMSGDEIRTLLIESGVWTTLRARPFGRVANPETQPSSVFITAIDTNPLAPPADKVIGDRNGDFERGLLALVKLTEGPVYVCTKPETNISIPSHKRLCHEIFLGPHPTGTVGLHIHTLDPVDRSKIVWYIGYQDVVAIGALLDSGKLDVERIVTLGGPAVREPRLIRTRIGASVDEIVEGELIEGNHRTISGSVLSGRVSSGEILGYLGRYHNQISVLREAQEREFLGWMSPGFNRFSIINTFISALMPRKKFVFNTSMNGSRRAIVPIGMYERVMPMDIEPTFLLRALLMQDVERAEELGCLELEEEDLALCTLVDPGKNEFGPYLRKVLTILGKEG